jgi:hypothetical protein
MASHIERRQFIFALGGAAVAWPLGAAAQQSRVPVLGFLASASEARYTDTAAAIRRGLNCMSSEHFGQLAWQFKRMSGSSGLRVQAAIAC